MGFWTKFLEDFNHNFIAKDRWMYITEGLKVTLTLTFFSVLIGIILGFLIAMIRVTYLRNGRKIFQWRNFSDFLVWLLNLFAKIYLTIIRGTPVVVQLLIIYFVIFASTDVDKITAAVIAFGVNSGAYVAEIFRGGILSIDIGQTEAGRSLGFGYWQTMWYIILPQAFKNVLPTLGNEFIVLLKETSVAGYIALQDLTKGGDIIRSQTWNAFFPLIAVAVIYLVMVMISEKLLGMLERRLAQSER